MTIEELGKILRSVDSRVSALAQLAAAAAGFNPPDLKSPAPILFPMEMRSYDVVSPSQYFKVLEAAPNQRHRRIYAMNLMVTADNGGIRLFTRPANLAIGSVTTPLAASDPAWVTQVRLDTLDATSTFFGKFFNFAPAYIELPHDKILYAFSPNVASVCVTTWSVSVPVK
jgi:hypothetical protein